MPFKDDFRDFQRFLESKGELIRIQKKVSTKYEIAAYVRKSSDTEGPAFIFENVKGYDNWNVVAGLYGTYHKLELALETDLRRMIDKIGNAMNNPIEPKIVSDGPCKEKILRRDKVDLTKMPVVKHSELDCGAYITAGCQFCTDAQGAPRMAIHRLLVKNKKQILFNPGAWRPWLSKLKEPLDIATVIGGGPYVDLASQSKVDRGKDKLGVAGALKGSSIKLVKCETVDVYVPSNSEIVIEGRVYPEKVETEGPYGEVAGYYVQKIKQPIMEVTAITMRDDAIYQDVLTGMLDTENHVMAWPSMVEHVYKAALNGSPEVKDVNVINYHIAIVAIKKKMQPEASNVIASVLGLSDHGVKICIVVDDDINVLDIKEVLWAVYTRCQPHRSVQIYPVMLGTFYDPSSDLPLQTSKMGIDATIPLDEPREKYIRAIVPGVEKVSW